MSQYAQPHHGLPLPGWIFFLRIAQGALALLILILSAIAANKLLGGVDLTYLVTPYPGFGFCWFAFAWTIVYLPAVIFAIPRLSPRFKPLVILVVLDAFSTLWWLVTFALLADDSRKLGLWITEGYTGTYYSTLKPGLDLTRTCAAFGAAEFVMFAVALGFVAAAIARGNKGVKSQFDLPTGPAYPVQEYPKASHPQPQPQPPPQQFPQYPQPQQQYQQPQQQQPQQQPQQQQQHQQQYQQQYQQQPQQYQQQPQQPQPAYTQMHHGSELSTVKY